MIINELRTIFADEKKGHAEEQQGKFNDNGCFFECISTFARIETENSLGLENAALKFGNEPFSQNGAFRKLLFSNNTNKIVCPEKREFRQIFIL